jgi:hypothetical protein
MQLYIEFQARSTSHVDALAGCSKARPLPGMIKAQCPECRYFFAAPVATTTLLCPDCAAGGGQGRRNEAPVASVIGPVRCSWQHADHPSEHGFRFGASVRGCDGTGSNQLASCGKPRLVATHRPPLKTEIFGSPLHCMGVASKFFGDGLDALRCVRPQHGQLSQLLIRPFLPGGTHPHAARTVARNSSTSRRSVSACFDSSPAAPSTCVAAAPVSGDYMGLLRMKSPDAAPSVS